jgi:hypothetical protein
MIVEVLRDPREAASAVRRALGLPASCPASSSLFELLRATVWSMAAPNMHVHVRRVLSAALPAWRILSGRSIATKEILRAELRSALATLEDAGDLLQLSGGYWGPVTARLVELPADSGRLLVGGVPSSLLPLESDAVEYHGPHRHLAKPAVEFVRALPAEDLASWSRRPDAPLQEWAGEVLESSERLPYTPASEDFFEFYTPASAPPGTPQFRRWSDSPGLTTTTLLARRIRCYGAREYRLVDVRAARIVGACDLQGVDVRRLMYALDSAAKNPVRARRLKAADRAEWLFTSELPRPEQRSFAAFGTLTIPKDRPFERRWVFARGEEIALAMLRDLGVRIEQQQQQREEPG